MLHSNVGGKVLIGEPVLNVSTSLLHITRLRIELRNWEKFLLNWTAAAAVLRLSLAEDLQLILIREASKGKLSPKVTCLLHPVLPLCVCVCPNWRFFCLSSTLNEDSTYTSYGTWAPCPRPTTTFSPFSSHKMLARKTWNCGVCVASKQVPFASSNRTHALFLVEWVSEWVVSKQKVPFTRSRSGCWVECKIHHFTPCFTYNAMNPTHVHIVITMWT